MDNEVLAAIRAAVAHKLAFDANIIAFVKGAYKLLGVSVPQRDRDKLDFLAIRHDHFYIEITATATVL